MNHPEQSYLKLIKSNRLNDPVKLKKSPIPSSTIRQSYKLSQAIPYNKAQRKSVSVVQSGREKAGKSIVSLVAKYTNHGISLNSQVNPPPGAFHDFTFSTAQHSGRTQSTLKNYPMAQNVRYHKRIKSEGIGDNTRWKQNMTPERLAVPAKVRYINSINLSEIPKMAPNENVPTEYNVQGNVKANITNNTNIIFINGDVSKINTIPNYHHGQYKGPKSAMRSDNKNAYNNPMKQLPVPKANIARIRQQYLPSRRIPDSINAYKREMANKSITTHKRAVSELEQSIMDKMDIYQRKPKLVSGRKTTMKTRIAKDNKSLVTSANVSNSSSINSKIYYMPEVHSHKTSLNFFHTLNKDNVSINKLHKKNSYGNNCMDLLRKNDIKLKGNNNYKI